MEALAGFEQVGASQARAYRIEPNGLVVSGQGLLTPGENLRLFLNGQHHGESNRRKTIQFIGADKKRRSLRLIPCRRMSRISLTGELSTRTLAGVNTPAPSACSCCWLRASWHSVDFTSFGADERGRLP